MSLLFQVFAHFLYFSFFLLPKVHRGNVRGTFSAKSLLMVMRSAGYWPVLLLMSLQPVHLSCASGFLWPDLAERKQFNPKEVLQVAGCTKLSFFSLFCKSGVVAPLCNPSIQTQGQCFLSVFSTRRRKSGWGVGEVKEKTGSFGQ